jgi:hypothetical protein
MNHPRYLLAKYIPDLRRGEPRNVGVVLWSPVGVAARFVAEKPGRPGEVDGRKIPTFVTSAPAYRQWVQFWRAELARSEIESVTRPDRKADRSSPDYLDVLADSSKGNFVLTEGGILLDPVNDLQDAVDFLFANLIEGPPAEEPRDPTLDEVCNELFDKLDLRTDPHFHGSGYAVECPLPGGATEQLEFSHAYKNGSLRRLYQRVPLTSKGVLQRKSVHDAAWMFERVTEAKILDRQGAVSLVYLPDAPVEADAQRWLRVLGAVSRVLNVHDTAEAEKEFRGLAALTA